MRKFGGTDSGVVLLPSWSLGFMTGWQRLHTGRQLEAVSEVDASAWSAGVTVRREASRVGRRLMTGVCVLCSAVQGPGWRPCRFCQSLIEQHLLIRPVPPFAVTAPRPLTPFLLVYVTWQRSTSVTTRTQKGDFLSGRVGALFLVVVG